MAPFEVDLGWKPKAPTDFLHAKVYSNDSINQFKERMSKSFRDAKFAHEVAKARQSAYIASKSQPNHYMIVDYVWLDKVLFKDNI